MSSLVDAVEEGRKIREKETERVKKGLAPMFAKARSRGLWFYSDYQNIWLSPLELEQANG